MAKVGQRIPLVCNLIDDHQRVQYVRACACEGSEIYIYFIRLSKFV